MTGPVSGDDGKYYILVKYEWNKELWWVSAEDVKELVPEGGRNKTAPNRFRPSEKNKPNHRWDQPEKLILPSVRINAYRNIHKNTYRGMLMKEVSSYFCIVLLKRQQF